MASTPVVPLSGSGGSNETKTSPALTGLNELEAVTTPGAKFVARKPDKPVPLNALKYSGFMRMRKNSRSSVDENDEVDMSDKSLDDRLVLSAGLGDLYAVDALLGHGVSVDARGVEVDRPGTTALIQATRYGRVEMIRLLLGHGASHHLEDEHGRTVWYYMCFSITIKGFRAAKEVAEAFFEHDVKITAEALHMAAYASSSNRVLRLFLDHLNQTVLSKGGKSRNWAKMQFENLILLDDPNARVTWPDGSKSPANETALDVIVRSGKEEITHPAVLAICHWKYGKFGRMMLRLEVVLYSLLVILVSCSCLMLQSRDPNDYSDDYGRLRAAAEIASLLVVVAFVVLEGSNVSYSLRSNMTLFAHMKKHILSISGLLSVVACALSRVSTDSANIQVGIQAVAVVLVWLRLLFLMRHHPRLGSFFIMVVDMIERDVSKFMFILAILMPGFAISLRLLVSHDLHNTDDVSSAFASHHSSLLESVNTLALVMGGSVNWLGIGHGVLIQVLFLAFLFLCPVLALNLLVAMFNSTYQKIQSKARHEFVVRWSQYVINRQYLVPEWQRHILIPEGRSYTIEGDYEFFFRPQYSGDTIDDVIHAQSRNLQALRKEQADAIEALTENLNQRMTQLEQTLDLQLSKIRTALQVHGAVRHMSRNNVLSGAGAANASFVSVNSTTTEDILNEGLQTQVVAGQAELPGAPRVSVPAYASSRRSTSTSAFADAKAAAQTTPSGRRLSPRR